MAGPQGHRTSHVKAKILPIDPKLAEACDAGNVERLSYEPLDNIVSILENL